MIPDGMKEAVKRAIGEPGSPAARLVHLQNALVTSTLEQHGPREAAASQLLFTSVMRALVMSYEACQPNQKMIDSMHEVSEFVVTLLRGDMYTTSGDEITSRSEINHDPKSSEGSA